MTWSAADDEVLPAGEGSRRSDGRNRAGRDAPSGVYLWRFTSGSENAGGKLVLLR